jgi:ubiquinone/menaquinone biosynthesis C-methylase UbiE
MQKIADVRNILSSAVLYSTFQNLVGAKKARRWLVECFWNIKKNCKIIDIGCGTGDILGYLPDGIEYLGFDKSEVCIKQAKNRFSDRAKANFLHGTAEVFLDDCRFHGVDIVLCIGVLHHLDDSEVIETLKFSKKVLKSGGLLLCIEPCFLVHQSKVSEWIMDLDRGSSIRTEEEWKRLLNTVFEHYSTSIATNLIRLPYIHILIKCFKTPN